MAARTQGGRTRVSARSGDAKRTAPAEADATHSNKQTVEHLGARLRALRMSRNLTIAQLAEAAGLTKGFVSRLERDQSSVSIAALLRICDVLNTSIGRLFEAPSTGLVPADDALVVELGRGLLRSVHTPSNVRELEVIRIRVAPGASAGREEYALHGGVQFVQVLSGVLEFRLEAERHRLAAGDSLTFRGNLLHTYRNASRTEPCEMLMVFAPAPA